MRRKVSEIERAQTASGQSPAILNIKYKIGAPAEIIGNIFHKNTMRTAHWDATTGECKFANTPAPEHNLVFNS